MRLVAPLAIASSGLMCLLLAHPCFQVFMARQAQVRAFCQKKLVRFGLVGAVALCAFTGHDRRMFAFPGHQSLTQVFMAGKAKRPLFAHDHSCIIRRMGVMACKAFPFCEGIMVGTARLGLHEITVTRSAHLRTYRLEHFFLVRSVRIVARITLGIDDGLMGVGFQELRLRLGMAPITDLVHPVFEEIPDIGTMGIMARTAFLFGERRVRVFYFQLSGLGVAGETECSVFCDEKILDLSGVRGMTGEAPLTTGHRGVINDDLCLFIRMAAKAERGPCMDKQGRVLRIMRVVAENTLSSLKRLMFNSSACL